MCVRERERGREGREGQAENWRQREKGAHMHLGGVFSLTIGFLRHADTSDIYLIWVSACIFLF